MSILLPIETAFIASFTYDGGSLSRLHTLQDAESDLNKQKFDKTLNQAKEVRAALAHFESEDGKAALAASGLTWTKSEFVTKALRYNDRSFVNKMVRVADRNDEHPSLITKYKREQSRLAAAGEKAPVPSCTLTHGLVTSWLRLKSQERRSRRPLRGLRSKPLLLSPLPFTNCGSSTHCMGTSW